ncbi:MAG: hypothetical protein HZB68_03925 [Candidatus Aenigmarchaeota archaeon]|nr:hypothetical protein [Candidatus Aenigmarchaeota archaeon]
MENTKNLIEERISFYAQVATLGSFLVLAFSTLDGKGIVTPFSVFALPAGLSLIITSIVTLTWVFLRQILFILGNKIKLLSGISRLFGEYIFSQRVEKAIFYFCVTISLVFFWIGFLTPAQ